MPKNLNEVPLNLQNALSAPKMLLKVKGVPFNRKNCFEKSRTVPKKAVSLTQLLRKFASVPQDSGIRYYIGEHAQTFYSGI